MLNRIFALCLGLLVALPAQAFETRAISAWVYDITTHTVLMDKNGEVPVPPASMSKLMTINMLFEALADGQGNGGVHDVSERDGSPHRGRVDPRHDREFR
jgi:D-alanyl-D-alanine carboxypeptidase (penicillin-binding protein 5/6)